MKKTIFLLLLPFILFASQKISIQLEWKHQFEFAGFYAAKEMGYYKDIGLDVSFKEYHENINIVQDVLDGKSDFGISSSALIRDKLKGKDVVLMASYFKQNVLALAVREGINSLKDLKGKKIMALPYEIEHTSLGVMLQENGIKREDYTLVAHNFNVDKFINSEVDAMSIFLTNQPYLIEKANKKFHIFNPSQYGLFSYDLELFSSKEFIHKHPQLTQDFVDATNKGWEYAFAHKQEIIQLIYQKYSQKKSQDALYFEAITMQKLFKTDIFSIGSVIPELVILNAQIYNQAQSHMTKLEFLELIKSYIGKDIQSPFNTLIHNKNIMLSQKERNYLKNKTIKMCIDPNWMPFEKLDHGKHIGMSADFFKILANNLQTNIEVVPVKTWSESLDFARQKRCDIMSLVMQTPERKKFLNFTTPYLNIPLVLVTHAKVPSVLDLTKLTHKQKIGMPKGYAYSEILQKKYPNINIVDVENSQDGLAKVKNRELFGYIGSLATAAYAFQKEYTGELKIAKKFNENWELGIGVRKDDPTLLHIMQKGVESITPYQYQEILNRWIAIKYEKGTDYTLTLQIIALGILILLLVLYSNRKLTKVNQELREAKRKAEEIQKAKSNFLANISHEIRTPMNSILGTTYLIRETALNNIQKNYILKIENATNNLLRLISDILDFSKLEARKLQLSHVDFHLLELLENLHATFNQSIYEKSLLFEINYDEDIPKYLHGDNLKLLQILTNLLSNAIKFTENGKIQLHIEQPKAKLFRFSISDTGIGLKQSQIADIFLSFTQADSATTRKYGGTGLGLAITKELVELMGGKIWVNSSYGKGSVFIFEIPLEYAKQQHTQRASKKSLQNNTTTPTKQKNNAVVKELFSELKEATKRRRPQLCNPILEELQKHSMSKEQEEIFYKVKQLLKKYKFAQARELL